MLSLTPQMRILVAVAPVDFRNGIDGLGGVCRRQLQEDPVGGYVVESGERGGPNDGGKELKKKRAFRTVPATLIICANER